MTKQEFESVVVDRQYYIITKTQLPNFVSEVILKSHCAVGLVINNATVGLLHLWLNRCDIHVMIPIEDLVQAVKGIMP